MRCISSTSRRSASTSGPSSSSASSSRKRVSTVRRSCQTPASIVVRCSICRSMRRFISRKACAARRTSRAPRGRKFGHFAALAEGLGGVGQPQDRLDLVAQEQDRDGEQQGRSADHPEQEDVRVGGVGLAALGEDAQHRLVELDADLDQVRVADRVDPERLADLRRSRATAPGRAPRRTAWGRAAAADRAAAARRSARAGRRRSCAGSRRRGPAG